MRSERLPTPRSHATAQHRDCTAPRLHGNREPHASSTSSAASRPTPPEDKPRPPSLHSRPLAVSPVANRGADVYDLTPGCHARTRRFGNPVEREPAENRIARTFKYEAATNSVRDLNPAGARERLRGARRSGANEEPRPNAGRLLALRRAPAVETEESPVSRRRSRPTARPRFRRRLAPARPLGRPARGWPSSRRPPYGAGASRRSPG